MALSISKEMVVAALALLILGVGVMWPDGPDLALQVPEVPPPPVVQNKPIEAFPNLRQALPMKPPAPPTDRDLDRHLFRPIELWAPASYPALELPPLPRVGVSVPGGDLREGLAFPGEVRVPRAKLVVQPQEEGGEQ